MIERLRPILIDESGLETDNADRILRHLLEAMREPTEAMLAAVRDPYMEFATDVECWRAMIDAALSERHNALKPIVCPACSRVGDPKTIVAQCEHSGTGPTIKCALRGMSEERTSAPTIREKLEEREYQRIRDEMTRKSKERTSVRKGVGAEG